MESVTVSHWKSLERWSPVAFLGAGGLLLGHAAVLGVQAFTDVTVPADVFAPVGHLLALMGVIGLYPVVKDRTPRLARVGVFVASIIAVGWAAVTSLILVTTFGGRPPELETLLGVLSVSVLVSTLLPYVLFGVITLRSDDTSRSVGLLLLVPAALLVVLLVNIAMLGVSPHLGVVIGAGLALSMLGIGYALRARGPRADRTALDDVTPG